MQIILLSGGSGKRLWPLSNGTRSKQFLRILPAKDGGQESMIQRVVRQLGEAYLDAKITVATSESQEEAIIAHLGNQVTVVTEPERRDTFPAIALAAAYLSKEKEIRDNEIIVVMPCDAFTDIGYFKTIKQMVDEIENNLADLILMGIKPSEPSTKFGYLVPQKKNTSLIETFTEKPDRERAKQLLKMGAVWNGGVFAFRLRYIREAYEKYLKADSFKEIRDRYNEFPKISFDYEVAEKATSVGVVYFDGIWKDLGTWDALSDELPNNCIGNAIEKNCENTTAINELGIPIVCQGLKNIIVTASPDGILVADKTESEFIKDTVSAIDNPAKFEERSWGSISVLSTKEYEDMTVTTSIMSLYMGHECMFSTAYDVSFSLLHGNGKIIMDNKEILLSLGNSIFIPAGNSCIIVPSEDLHILKIENIKPN